MVGSRKYDKVLGKGLSTKGWIFLGLLALVVALTGGASRYDAIQIIPLRVLSALLLIPALYYLSMKNLKQELALVFLFAVFVLLIMIQLVPLPPSFWQGLPGRGEVARMDGVLGYEGLWRPLTMAPMRTWNAFGSLIVPISGLLLAIAFGAGSRALLKIIAALGVLNALLGVLQKVGGASSVTYFYEVTNRGSVVGIFANENHAAIFAACSLLVVTTLGLRERASGSAGWPKLVYPAAFFLIFVTALIGGSRIGFVAGIGAMVLSACMFALIARPSKARSAANPLRRWADRHPHVVVFLPVLVLLFTIAAFLGLERAPAFHDLLSQDSFADLRWSLWPVFTEMLGTYWVFGAGIGSFEQVYKIYEPSDLLMPQYVNQAHNDWVQLVIEGGGIGAIILLGLIAWLVKSVVALTAFPAMRIHALFWLGIFTIISVASMVDYPLRTPIFQLVTVWLLVALSRDIRDAKAT